jgi:ABC-2 type transport system permease protein
LARPAGRVSALFVSKDVRVFLRDPTQWSQFAIFFGLLAIYILNLRNLRYDIERGFWMHLVSTLNLGSTCLILGTLTTRFVFPQASLEGRRFWVLGLAPVRRRQILLGKFVFSLGGALLVAETLVVLSNIMLRMPADVFLVQGAAAALACVGLTGLAAGLGAVFPDYGQTDPGRIVSGFGGTLTLVASVVYVAAVVGATAVFSHLRLVSSGRPAAEHAHLAALAVAFACTVTAVTAGVPLTQGMRAIERAEF